MRVRSVGKGFPRSSKRRIYNSHAPKVLHMWKTGLKLVLHVNPQEAVQMRETKKLAKIERYG